MITVWPYICQLLCPLHIPYCTQHITFILTQYGGEWAGDETQFLQNKVVLQKDIQLVIPHMNEPIRTPQNDSWHMQPIKSKM